jgi:putative ABC transport system permease protein
MKELLRAAYTALRRQPLRSLLTIFGVQIAVCTVTCITTAGVVARTRVMAEVSSFGPSMLTVQPEGRAGVRGGRAGRVTQDDGVAVAREAREIASVAPVLTALIVADGPRAARVVKLTGTNPEYFGIANWALASGSSWDEREGALRTRLCVIGATVRSALFGADDPIGRYLRFGPHLLRVSGVLKAKGSDLLGNEQDDVVLVPIETYRATVGGPDPESVGALLVSATAPGTVDRAASQIEALLRQRHRLLPGDADDFVVKTQKAVADLYRRVLQGLTLVVVALASISLVVGGVGIMNIMLVSVTERTREIGIHLALGVTPERLRTQFLVEATLLSTVGGLLGLLCAAGLVFAAREGLPLWPIRFDPAVFLLGLLASVLTGIAFGYVPAQRASKLEPVAAMGRS